MIYLYAAYAITWIIILGYVISLAHRRWQIRREAELLTQSLARQEKEH